MKKRKLKIKNIVIALILIVAVLFSLVRYNIYLPLPTYTNGVDTSQLLDIHNPDISVDSKAHLVVNMKTNQILHESNMDEALPIYSMTKSMLIYTAMKEMENQKRNWDEIIISSELMDKVNLNPIFSSANMSSNQQYAIRELIEATLVVSGNDSALQLAQSIFGSPEKAVEKMNETAKTLGFENTKFVSVNGLDGEMLTAVGIPTAPGKNLMSAREVYLLLQHINQEFPQLIEITSQPQISFGKLTDKIQILKNSNALLSGGTYQLDGVMGFKTGSNSEPYSYALSAIRTSQQQDKIVSIVIAAESYNALYQGMHELYNYEEQLKRENIQDQLNLSVPVSFSKEEVFVRLENPYYLYFDTELKTPMQIGNLNQKFFNRRINEFQNVKKDTKVGSLTVGDSNAFISQGIVGELNVKIKDEIIQKNIFEKGIEWISSFLKKVL